MNNCQVLGCKNEGVPERTVVAQGYTVRMTLCNKHFFILSGKRLDMMNKGLIPNESTETFTKELQRDSGM